MSLSDCIIEKPEEGLFTLPGGYITNDGTCHKEVKLRQLTGKEEEIIVDVDTNSNIPSALTTLLANCIQQIGPIKEITVNVIQKLLICDRDYLLLKLRQITFGNRIDARVLCPNNQCKKPMDIDFDTRNIEIQRKVMGSCVFSHTLSGQSFYKDKNGIIHRDIEFRLPNVYDQEQIAQIYEANQSKALTKLIARCLIRIGSINTIDEDLVQSFSIPTRREIDLVMRKVSPTVDLQINIHCPECGTDFSSLFDIHDFFLGK